MASLKEQTEAQMNKTRHNNPSFAKSVDELLRKAKHFRNGGNVLPVNSKAPDFILPDATHALISLDSLRAQGPVVLLFYRGSWCPYCNLQLRAIAALLTDFERLGARLVAISPQIPDESLSIVEKQALRFPVLSDQDAKVAESFGVAWKVPDILLEHMQKDRGLDLERINNGNDSVLPIPATFVIDQNGKIAWQFVDVDYRNRAEPEDIIHALEQLSM